METSASRENRAAGESNRSAENLNPVEESNVERVKQEPVISEMEPEESSSPPNSQLLNIPNPDIPYTFRSQPITASDIETLHEDIDSICLL